jgi:hypothetical protein
VLPQITANFPVTEIFIRKSFIGISNLLIY